MERCEREPVRQLSCILFVRKDHPILTTPSKDLRSRLREYDLITPSEARACGLPVHDSSGPWNISRRRQPPTIDSFPVMKRLVATSEAVGVTTTGYAASKRFKAAFAVPEVNLFRSLPLCFAVRARRRRPLPSGPSPLSCATRCGRSRA